MNLLSPNIVTFVQNLGTIIVSLFNLWRAKRILKETMGDDTGT